MLITAQDCGGDLDAANNQPSDIADLVAKARRNHKNTTKASTKCKMLYDMYLNFFLISQGWRSGSILETCAWTR